MWGLSNLVYTRRVPGTAYQGDHNAIRAAPMSGQPALISHTKVRSARLLRFHGLGRPGPVCVFILFVVVFLRALQVTRIYEEREDTRITTTTQRCEKCAHRNEKGEPKEDDSERKR